MEYLFTLIVLAGSLFGLYFLINKQINKTSQDNSKELESKLESFIEAFKLTSASPYVLSITLFFDNSKQLSR